ncbi:MAG TPA: hypothetical protein VMM92_02800, partial [Thermoanaerobaculia bacterium]|nr:hypothetical protein [Thermoanaerobaculia bacterium]
MSDHPRPAVLEAFLRADLPDAEMRGVLQHLVRGCPACQETLAGLGLELFRPSRMSPLQDDSVYDFPIARAIRGALQQAQSLTAGGPAPPAEWSLPPAQLVPSPLTALPTGLSRRARCEALLDTARSLRHRDSEGMVMLAAYAAVLADRLGP